MEEVAAFSKMLEDVLGEKATPGLAVDLSDLLGTLYKGIELLEGLQRSSDKESVAKGLLGVELLLVDEIGLIARDVLPPLRVVKNQLYDGLGESDSHPPGDT